MSPLPNTELVFTKRTFVLGDNVINMPASQTAWTIVQIDVARDVVPGGLNTLTNATLVTITFEYSTDNGVTWIIAEVAYLTGGIFTNPVRLGGGTVTANDVGFSRVGLTYPSGSLWRLVVNVAGPSSVVVSGTVSWQ